MSVWTALKKQKDTQIRKTIEGTNANKVFIKLWGW
jgi:hypothetical protein